MATNRMWLRHKPTGAKALIAKQFAGGWEIYGGPINEPFYSPDDLLTKFGDMGTPEFDILYDSDPEPKT